MPDPHIALTRYKGFNGGFATRKTVLWRVEIVGPTAKRSLLPFGPTSNSEKIASEASAYELAQGWSELTGWPIFRFRETIAHSHIVERE